MNGHRVSGSKVAAIGAHRLSLRSGRESDTKQQDGRCLSRSSLYGPDWAMFCFFIRVRGRRLLRFVCARAHCCCCLEKRKPYSFFGQKKERDGRTARVLRTDDWPCAEEKVVVRCCSFLCVVVVCRLRLAFNIDALLFLLILLLPPIRKWATTNKKERIWFFFYRRLSLND